MNEKEQAIFDIIMKHMRINGSEDCSTSDFERDVEDAAAEIAAEQSVESDECPTCAGLGFVNDNRGRLGVDCSDCNGSGTRR